MTIKSLRITLAIIIAIWLIGFGISVCIGIEKRAMMDSAFINAKLDSNLIQVLIKRSKDFHNMHKESEEIRSIYLEQGENQWPKSLR